MAVSSPALRPEDPVDLDAVRDVLNSESAVIAVSVRWLKRVLRELEESRAAGAAS